MMMIVFSQQVYIYELGFMRNFSIFNAICRTLFHVMGPLWGYDFYDTLQFFLKETFQAVEELISNKSFI